MSHPHVASRLPSGEKAAPVTDFAGFLLDQMTSSFAAWLLGAFFFHLSLEALAFQLDELSVLLLGKLTKLSHKDPPQAGQEAEDYHPDEPNGGDFTELLAIGGPPTGTGCATDRLGRRTGWG